MPSEPKKRANLVPFAYVGIILAFIVISLAYLLKPEIPFIYDALSIAAGFMAATAALGLVIFDWKLSGRLSDNFLVFLGISGWAAAEAIWSFYTIVLQTEVPPFSAADVFWLAGYVPLIMFFLRKFIPKPGKFSIREHLGIFASLALTIYLSYILLLSRLFALEDWDILSKAAGAAYIAMDALLILFTILAAILMRGGSLMIPNLLLFLGFLVTGIADLLYYNAVIAGTYGAGAFCDYTYALGYLLLAFSCAMTVSALRKAIGPE